MLNKVERANPQNKYTRKRCRAEVSGGDKVCSHKEAHEQRKDQGQGPKTVQRPNCHNKTIEGIRALMTYLTKPTNPARAPTW